MIVAGVLKEELRNLLNIKKEYVREIARLPKGCIVRKNIKGREYYYIAKRVGAKVEFLYRKNMSQEEVKKYEDAKNARRKYRKLLSGVNNEIRFIRRALRGQRSV